MTDMPTLQFAQVNGIKMGYYEAGVSASSAADKTPVVLCHGWPEIAFSWRHQIKALSEAGIRVIAPDQRGYGSTDCPPRVEDYDLTHLTGDLVGLLDHLKIDKAIFVGHDWGGFVVWSMAMRHPTRVAGVVGVNTPHHPRPPIDPIELFRKRFGSSMYIVQFQDPTRTADNIFDTHIEQVFDFFMRRPDPRQKPIFPGVTSHDEQPSKLPLAFPQYVAGYDASKDPRPKILSEAEKKVFVDAFSKTGFTGGINWYRNYSRNWAFDADLDHTIRVPSLMIMAELDVVLPPSDADAMETLVPDLEKYLVKDCGHWTQHEKPDELGRKLIEWYQRRFG
ncbi:MAG: alpha/beta hydrolase [Cytophagales bacterium]|nr:alpha/beta hydrolase [Cytophagales bacterium]